MWNFSTDVAFLDKLKRLNPLFPCSEQYYSFGIIPAFSLV
ncbi:hypothetical protein A33Q_3496 [Indibacter alkaliphilus LW1]|uniref:Uncharacterized protein n=1 Tax=Indibacter alkaliphilus (strain CCUG 57479 / KCTC 22604 / LW1) TaxID=1189612 RepID=S2D3T4_INDAL|nr:hypothetical protein A33Q_3490 [Indibacter alkaliphilus LW1]EOZ93550.1 hypothetical protein A33Q_3496 [Indibacter alkaliphilus LW1]